MHSIIFAFVAVASLASAGPAINKRTECSGSGAYYVCANNNFRGYCTSDPCAEPWCPDFKEGTCDLAGTWVHKTEEPIGSATPEPTTIPTPQDGVCPIGTGFFQVCSENGFRGCCKTDACSGAWCPDYEIGTYELVHSWKVRVRQSDPTVCAPGTGFFQSCSNGFRGCCKTDACAQPTPVCLSN
ncbi:Fc.00g072900.m01.CDS01 [Cosmosporella sp. VM-42]